MKVSDLPKATLTLAEATKKFQSMDPLDRTAILLVPFEDIVDEKPTPEQMTRIIEHWKEVLRLKALEDRGELV